MRQHYSQMQAQIDPPGTYEPECRHRELENGVCCDCGAEFSLGELLGDLEADSDFAGEM